VSRTKAKAAGAFISSLLAAVFNTVFFVGGLLLLFGSTDYIKSFGATAWDVVILLVAQTP
jgi:hypothetical protein